MTTMLVLKRLAALAATVTSGLLIGGAALAGSGQPSPWQMGFQQAATPVMENIIWFHDFLLWLIIAITIFVLALLVIVVVRFNSRANPTPSRTTHNTLLEVMWTLVPVIILVAIAVPSFKLLFLELTIPQADVTVKATGKQWYWSYSYPDLAESIPSDHGRSYVSRMSKTRHCGRERVERRPLAGRSAGLWAAWEIRRCALR